MNEDITLVIAEKPDAARKLSAALGHSTTQSRWADIIDVPVAFDGKHYVICSAIGHLFEIGDPESNRSVFPVYDVDWFPKGTGRKRWGRNLHYQKKIANRLASIANIAKKAKTFVNACDYDIEGETIGSNILEFACGIHEGILRAKFSTLTKEDLRVAFSKLERSTSRLSAAGRIRHEIDFLWGVNLSRALTQSANHSGLDFANVTIGRVQGPTLAFVVDREIERTSHVPLPFWTISCMLGKEGDSFEATFSNSPLRNMSYAQTVFDSVSKAQFARVSSAQTFLKKLPPRYPFNLGELQKEAFYNFGFTPSSTLAIAEKLYLKALISYPRTDSQKLPPSIHPEGILLKIALSNEYYKLVQSLLSDPSRRRFPLQGPTDDPAHPAIHPTGDMPKQTLSAEENKLFDLIVKRFCSAFAPDAVIEKSNVTFDIESHEFVAEWERIIDEGWMKYYPTKRNASSETHQTFTVGEKVTVEKALMEEKYTLPPSRYNEGSLLAKLESEGIGTKATRAETITTLVNRGYLRKSLNLIPDENAMILIDLLKKYCPQIVSPEMTRSLEKKLDLLQESKVSETLVIEEEMFAIRTALRSLVRIEHIDWQRPTYQSRTKNLKIGACPNCKTGTLDAIRSFKTKKRFIRCSNYQSACKTSSPLPPRGIIKPTNNRCDACGWPMIIISYRGVQKPENCSNFACKSRKFAYQKAK